MKKIFVACVLMALLCCSISFADNASNIGSNKNIDSAVIIADLSSGIVIEVNSDGSINTIAMIANTFARKESSQNLATGALSYTTNFAAKTKIISIKLHAASTISQTVTTTFDSKTGANYDTVLASDTLSTEQDFVYIPENLVLESGDEIKIACTNTGTPAVTVYVTIIGETLQ